VTPWNTPNMRPITPAPRSVDRDRVWGNGLFAVEDEADDEEDEEEAVLVTAPVPATWVVAVVASP
jgi:hypothetical protein